MKLGALLVPSDGRTPDHAIVNQARAFESAGFESIWSAQAIGRGFMMADPFVALSAAAVVTEKVELGTAILQLPLYNPADVVLKAYSLALLSDNRFILGVGAGSTKADYGVHNLAFNDRFKNFDQAVDQLRKTFSDGSAGDGNVTPWKSVKGGPPVFYGTWGKNVARAAADFDGWIASGMHREPAECAEALARFREAGGGRAIVSTIQVNGETDPSELRDRLQGFASTGFDDAVVMVFPGGPSIDQVRAMVS